MFITYDDYTEHNICLKYNEELAGEYYKNIVHMSEKFGLENDVRASVLSRCKVLTLEEQTLDEDELWKLLEKALTGACESLLRHGLQKVKTCVRISLKAGWNALAC